MKARLKQSYRWNAITLQGVEIVKTEFREVGDIQSEFLEFETESSAKVSETFGKRPKTKFKEVETFSNSVIEEEAPRVYSAKD